MTIASLIVDVAANTATLQKDVEKVNKTLDSITGVAGALGKALVAAFSVTAVVAAGKQVIDYAGHITDLSARLGVSTTAIQQWENAFGPAGVTVDAVAKAAGELGAKLVGGDKSAVSALQKMGLSVEELKRMAPEARFNLVADAVGRLQNDGERLYASKTLFGKSGTELLAALDGHLQENIDRFTELGLVIDQETIAAADDFGDQLGVMSKQLMGIVATVVGPLLPALSTLGNILSWVGREVIGPVLNVAVKGAMTALSGLYTSVATMVAGLLDLGAKIPGGVGDKFEAAAAAVRKSIDATANYAANLWQQKDATDQAGAAAQQAAPKLLGLGGASEDAAAAHKKQVAELEKLRERIHDIDEAAGRGLFGGRSVADMFAPLESYMAGLRAQAEGLKDALGIEAATAQSSIITVGVQMDLEPVREGLRMMNELAATSLSGTLSRAMASMPQFLQQAFTGGGGVSGAFKAVGSQIGSNLGEGLFKAGGALNGMGNKLAGVLGSGFGLALPGIGSVIGSLAGPLIAKFGNLVGKLLGNPEKQINPIREAFVQMHGGLAALNQKAAEAGVTVKALLDAKNPKAYEQAIRDLNAAFEFQENAMKRLDETTKKYGFSIEQLGPAFARQQLDKQAQTLFEDFKILTAAGIDVDTVLGKMGESINQFVGDALRTGTEIPAAMAPMLQRMVEMGTLTDASGNVITDLEASGVRFSETMTQGFAKVVQSVERLADAISRGLGLAIDNIPDPVVTGRVQWNVDPIPGVDGVSTTDVVPMAAGGYGTVTKPTLFLAGEAGPEEVAFSGANKRFAGSSTVVDMSAVRSELQALRQQQAEQQAYFASQFARDLSRAVRDEVQKVSVIRR